ncbi:alanine-trna acid forming aminoacyl-trna and related binding isoform 1 [Nannochloropsis oceanica]
MTSCPLRPTERLYLDDTHLYTTTSTVLAVEPVTVPGDKDSMRFTVVTEATVFHPQGGGQPSDVGCIVCDGDAGVTFVVDSVRSGEGGVIYHFGTLASTTDQHEDGNSSNSSSSCSNCSICLPFHVGQAVTLEIDADSRRLHSRLHSAGHALDVAVLQLGMQLRPSKGYHFQDAPYVEYFGRLLPEAGTAVEVATALTEKMKTLVEADIPFEVKVTSKVDAAKLLPGGKDDVAHFAEEALVRLVSVGGNLCLCGGTHVKSTGELGMVEVTKIKTKKDVTRISYRLKVGAEEEVKKCSEV